MSEIESKILIGLYRNVNSLNKKTAKIASSLGLTLSQFEVLEVLYSKGNLTVGEVRDKTLSSMGTIPLVINNLVKKGYVQRLKHEKDKRVCILELTEEGRKVIGELAPKNQEMIKDYMKVLNEDEKENLLNIVKKIGGRNNG